jgi:hypothetical protein
MITRRPNSPIAFASASATPERIPGRMFGNTTRGTCASSEAPSERPPPPSPVELDQHRLHGATTNGSVTKRSASTIAVRV